jgi:hypothetical protein
MNHRFCSHNTLHEASLCRDCNPKRLTESEFRAVLGAMLDPRKVPPKFARVMLELADLAAAAEASEAATKKGEIQ